MRNTVWAFVCGAVAGLLLAAVSGPAWATIWDHVTLNVTVIIVGVSLFIGVSLGVLVMALLVAADRGHVPEPAPLRAPSWRALGPFAGMPARSLPRTEPTTSPLP